MTDESPSERAAAQRRAFVRVAISSPMQLEIQDEDADTFATHKGVIVDLSESAARCALWIDASIRLRLSVRCAVVLRFMLLNDGFVVPGDARLRKVRKDGMTEIIVEFDRPDVHATQLRRALFAEQIRQAQMTKLS